LKALYLITARGGSKGIPGKNIKPLSGKPLIHYSIDAARCVSGDENICVSTDDPEIIRAAESYGLKVPFVRPAELATDTAGSYEVILHALDFYEQQNRFFDCVVLLQPTSPLRKASHLKEALSKFNKDIDMVVSVSEPKINPFHNLFIEQNGFLSSFLKNDHNRRQDAEKVYSYNGSIYIMQVKSLREKKISAFDKVVKYVMPPEFSLDIDEPYDWELAEFLIKRHPGIGEP
jgi:N-acylneuraminate cytidylyltransferase